MSLFQTLTDVQPSAQASVQITLQDQVHQVPANLNVAAALLLCGYSQCRSTPVSGAPRAPYCMMGVCFDCLVEIDGVPNQQACLTPVREGMVVRWQDGKASLDQLGAEL